MASPFLFFLFLHFLLFFGCSGWRFFDFFFLVLTLGHDHSPAWLLSDGLETQSTTALPVLQISIEGDVPDSNSTDDWEIKEKNLTAKVVCTHPCRNRLIPCKTGKDFREINPGHNVDINAIARRSTQLFGSIIHTDIKDHPRNQLLAVYR